MKKVFTLSLLSLMGVAVVGCESDGDGGGYRRQTTTVRERDGDTKQTTTVREADGDVKQTTIKRDY